MHRDHLMIDKTKLLRTDQLYIDSKCHFIDHFDSTLKFNTSFRKSSLNNTKISKEVVNNL